MTTPSWNELDDAQKLEMLRGSVTWFGECLQGLSKYFAQMAAEIESVFPPEKASKIKAEDIQEMWRRFHKDEPQPEIVKKEKPNA